mgnify:CR=1 FL=1
MNPTAYSYRYRCGQFQAEIDRLSASLASFGNAPQRSLLEMFSRIRFLHRQVIDGGILNVERDLTPLATDLVSLLNPRLFRLYPHIREAIADVLGFHAVWMESHRKQVSVYAADMAGESLPEFAIEELRYPNDAPLEQAFEGLLDMCGVMYHACENPSEDLPWLPAPTPAFGHFVPNRPVRGELHGPVFC